MTRSWAAPKQPHPMQPLVVVEEGASAGVVRFQPNAIVRWLIDEANAGRTHTLNDIACQGFADEDHRQLAQLIGYSVSGYGDLSYVEGDGSYDLIAAEAERLHASWAEGRKTR